jgi:hypothetical protein
VGVALTPSQSEAACYLYQYISGVGINAGGDLSVTFNTLGSELAVCNPTTTVSGSTITPEACKQMISTFQLALLTGRTIYLYFPGTFTGCGTTPVPSWARIDTAPYNLNYVKVMN